QNGTILHLRFQKLTEHLLLISSARVWSRAMERGTTISSLRWPAWLNAAALLVASLVAVATLSLQVRPGTEIVAVAFPPWWSTERAFQAAASADAAIVRMTAVPSLLVVRLTDMTDWRGSARPASGSPWIHKRLPPAFLNSLGTGNDHREQRSCEFARHHQQAADGDALGACADRNCGRHDARRRLDDAGDPDGGNGDRRDRVVPVFGQRSLDPADLRRRRDGRRVGAGVPDVGAPLADRHAHV